MTKGPLVLLLRGPFVNCGSQTAFFCCQPCARYMIHGSKMDLDRPAQNTLHESELVGPWELNVILTLMTFFCGKIRVLACLLYETVEIMTTCKMDKRDTPRTVNSSGSWSHGYGSKFVYELSFMWCKGQRPLVPYKLFQSVNWIFVCP